MSLVSRWILISCMVTAPAFGQAPSATLKHVATIRFPVAMAAPPDDPSRMLVALRPGQIHELTSTGVNPAPLLDLAPHVSTFGDGGLLGVAYAPDYATSRHLYVYYTQVDTHDGVLARYTLTADGHGVVAGSQHVVWRYPRPADGHNGGWIGFGADGDLYLSSGDGGTYVSPDPPGRAQNLSDPCGKIHRIDPSGDDFPDDPDRNFRVPSSNPFSAQAGALPQVWAYGLRNPWRCSFDRLTHDLWIADVGHEQWEEIDWEPAGGVGGRNYGWKCMEGPVCTGYGGCVCPSAEITPPVWSYDHSVGCSISGGYVYRGSAIPSLYGRYFFADWCTGHVYSVVPTASGVGDLVDHTTAFSPSGQPPPAGVANFGEDADGELYVCNHSTGEIFKIIPWRCGMADIAGLGGNFGGDGFLTVDDLVSYLSAFFASDLDRGDLASVGGATPPDHQLTVDDLVLFLSAFFAGCP